MEKRNLNFSHTNYKIINDKDKIVGTMKIKKILNYNDLLKSCDIGLSTVVIKSKIIKKNLFNKLKTKEDYALWLKFLRDGVEIVGMNETLGFWRKNADSLSSDIAQKVLDAFRLYNKYENFNFFSSVYLTIRLSIFFFIKKINQKLYL